MEADIIVLQASASPRYLAPVHVCEMESSKAEVRLRSEDERNKISNSLSRSKVGVRQATTAVAATSLSSRFMNKRDPNLARRLARNSRRMNGQELDGSGGAEDSQYSNNASASMDGTFAQEQRVAKRLQRLIKKYIKFRTYFVALMIVNVIVFLGIFASLISLGTDESAVLRKMKEIRIKKLRTDAVQNHVCQEFLMLEAFVVLPNANLILQQVKVSRLSVFQLYFLNTTGYEISKYSRVGNGPFHSVSTLEDKSGRDYWLDFVKRNISVSRLNYNIVNGVEDRNTLTVRFLAHVNHTSLGNAIEAMVASVNISSVLVEQKFTLDQRNCFFINIDLENSLCNFPALEDGGCVPRLSETSAQKEYDRIEKDVRIISVVAVVVGTLQMFFLVTQFTCECMIKRQYRKVRGVAGRVGTQRHRIRLNAKQSRSTVPIR